MKNNGIFLDKNVLGQLADSIYRQGDDYNPQFIKDYNKLSRGGRIQPGYYDLSSVSIPGLGEVNILDIIKRYYGR